MVDLEDEAMTFKQKCELLNVSRGSMYYKPVAERGDKDNDVLIMNEMRDIHQDIPSYGYRRMLVALREKGFVINHKRVSSLFKLAGLRAIYPQKKTTIRNPQHKVFPYLLRGIVIDRPNQVWQVDITYIKIRGGFVYLICLIDVFSRKIMGWKLSTSLDTAPCLEAFNNALKHGAPEIVNSDQGCQFTSQEWIAAVQHKSCLVSMDGKGRWADNVYIERLWRTIKYELVFLHSFDTVQQIRDELGRYIIFYNTRRYHSKLNYHTPDAIFAKKLIPTRQDLFNNFALEQTRRCEVSMF